MLRRLPRSLLLVSSLSAGLLLARPAMAGDAAAEALFLEGRQAVERGDFRTACAKFHESNRLEFAVGTLFNIGDCEEKLGKVATAWQSFREVAQRLPPGDDRIPIALQRATALEPRLPRLTIRLAAGAPPGTRVVRGGTELGAASFGTALPIDPGEHTIEVQAENHLPASFQVRLAEGERKELEVRPGVTTETGGSSRKTTAMVVGGIGVAGLLVGGITGAMTLGKKSVVDANCNQDKRCNRTGFDAVESGRTLGTVSAVSFVVGALGVGAGAYLFLSDKRPSSPQSALLPAAGPGAFQLHWIRSWLFRSFVECRGRFFRPPS